MSKKKKYFILLSILFVLAAITAGIYLFVSPKTNGSTTYTVDKYSDVTNWCDTNLKDGKLTVDCKALLINIDINSCFEIQVITKNKELKDLTVCEKNDTLSYTNDVLGYKKLMPVDMVFTYTKEGILGDYSFNNVSFDKVEDTYIQSIVNEDIANLVTIDPSTTTIQNSVDFCPRPETLPSYVTEANRTAYTKYFNENIMAKEEYTNGYLYNWDDSTIRILFACDSVENMGYTGVCDKTKINNINLLPQNIVQLKTMPTYGKLVDEKDMEILKEISLIYDNMYLVDSSKLTINLDFLNNLVSTINGTLDLSEEVFCSMTQLYSSLSEYNPQFQRDMNYIYSWVENNATKTNSHSCLQILPKDSHPLNPNGAFIRLVYSSSKFGNLTICNNLTSYFTSNNTDD